MFVSGSEIVGGALLTAGTDGLDGGMGLLAAGAAWGDFGLSTLTFCSALSSNATPYTGPSSTPGMIGRIVAGEKGEQFVEFIANAKTGWTESGLKSAMGVYGAAQSARSGFGTTGSSKIGGLRMQIEAAERARNNPSPLSPVPPIPSYVLPGSNSQSGSSSNTLYDMRRTTPEIDGTECKQPLIDFLKSQ
jgi:hypothetical protein